MRLSYEFESFYLKMNTNNYLKRLDCKNNEIVSLENLRSLQKQHLLTIPFENLSLMTKNKVEMNLEKIFNKIINEHRGGFCFELNQLFAWLLKALGYELKLVACRVFGVSTKTYTPWYSHIAIVVKLNEKEYLVDVGFSSACRFPIELVPDRIQKDLIGRIKINSANSDETGMQNSFTLLRCEVADLNQWTPMYQFSMDAKQISDFEEMLEWVQSPACPRFFNRSICVIHFEKYLLMLVGYRLTKIEFNEGIEINRIDTELNNKEEVYQTIRTLFNLIKFNQKFEPIDIK